MPSRGCWRTCVYRSLPSGPHPQPLTQSTASIPTSPRPPPRLHSPAAQAHAQAHAHAHPQRDKTSPRRASAFNEQVECQPRAAFHFPHNIAFLFSCRSKHLIFHYLLRCLIVIAGGQVHSRYRWDLWCACLFLHDSCGRRTCSLVVRHLFPCTTAVRGELVHLC